MNKLLWSSSLALATAAFLTACGDELCDDKQRAFFWSATESEKEGDAYYVVLSYNNTDAVVSNNNSSMIILSKTSRMSIRCLKD